jgi:hypothetical protein
MQEVFWYIKEAIDAYFGGSAFSVSVVAACAHGVKPTEEEQEDGPLFDGMDAGLGSPEEEDDLDSIATDPRRTPLPRKKESSFGRDHDVSTVDEKPHRSVSREEKETPRPKGLSEDAARGLGAGSRLRDRDEAPDPFEAMRGGAEDPEIQDFSGEIEELDVDDLEEIEIDPEPEAEREPSGKFGDFEPDEDYEDEDFPTLRPQVRTVEEGLDEEDIPTMPPRQRAPADEEIEPDPDDVPTKGPHPSPFGDLDSEP